MVDVQAIHDEIYRIREETDADRDVRQHLLSIERALSGMDSEDEPPGKYADRLKEVRAELDRLSDDTDGKVSAELDRLREQVRQLELEDE